MEAGKQPGKHLCKSNAGKSFNVVPHAVARFMRDLMSWETKMLRTKAPCEPRGRRLSAVCRLAPRSSWLAWASRARHRLGGCFSCFGFVTWQGPAAAHQRVQRRLAHANCIGTVAFCRALRLHRQRHISFAKILISEVQPDLLLLDEPTNHLDVHAVTWLEAQLGRIVAICQVASEKSKRDLPSLWQSSAA